MVFRFSTLGMRGRFAYHDRSCAAPIRPPLSEFAMPAPLTNNKPVDFRPSAGDLPPILS
jgi:hypothetical protein